MTEKDAAAFVDTGIITDIPPKENAKVNKAVADETDRIERERVKETVRVSMGEQPAAPVPVGTMTKDCPQLVFRVLADVIGCKKFELEDSEASTMATHLNVLIPLSGKMASLVIVLMITLNKVYVCMDAIKAKFSDKSASVEKPAEKPANLPEQIS
jgi:hypothetical protein